MSSRKRRFDDDNGDSGGRWMTSYGDFMTTLLSIFVLLFSFSTLTSAIIVHEYKNVESTDPTSKDDSFIVSIESKGEDSSAEESFSTSSNYDDESDVQSEFDLIFEYIKNKIEESGYSDSIFLERGEGYIIFRFNDTVLFYPDSPKMKPSSNDILEYMGDVLATVKDKIEGIQIGGHTAEATNPYVGISPWELSCDRAITVLYFFKDHCELPEEKMVAMGFAHYQPIVPNDTEENMAKNRRVEVKITY